jgi:hypothetical protein
MDEAVNGTGGAQAESQPADDIRSALAAAIVTSEEEAAARDKPEPKAAKPTNGAAEGEHAAGDEAAADTGTEKAADTAAKKPATEEGAAEPEKTDEEKTAEKTAAETKAVGELTGKWSAKDKETFAKLAPEAKELLLRRHKDMEAAFTRKTQDIADFRKRYEPVDKIFEPYRDKMKAGGWTEQKLVEGWANVEKRLMDGDGVNVVAGLMKGYNVDLAKVAQAMGYRPPAAAAPRTDATGAEVPAPPAVNLPPEVIETLRDLRQRVDARDQKDMESTQRAAREAETRVMSDIEKFKSAQDDKGELQHPHFDELEADMTELASAAIAAKRPVPSLKDLYEKAVWANPSTRDAALAAREKAQQAKSAADARAKAAAAKKAGSSVHGAPGSGQAPQGTRPAARTLREELEANTAEATSRL